MGPLAHIVYAASAAKEAGLRLEAGARDALLSGALAPDAGYYPGAEHGLARIAHGEKALDLAGALGRAAAGPEERAFALGWLSHLQLDRRGHAELVDPAAGATYQHDHLSHVRVEWGVDCRLLAQPVNGWLWSLFPLEIKGVDLWHQALGHAGRGDYTLEDLRTALAAEFQVTGRLPGAWLRLGLTQQPGRANPWGRMTGPLFRRLLALYFSLRKDVNRLGVVSPKLPDEPTWQKWLVILADVREDMKKWPFTF